MRTEYKIAIPKDNNGYTHRLCPVCEYEFGIRAEEFPNRLHCPYCTKVGDLREFNIPEQFDYAVEEGKHQIFYDVQKELQNMMRKSFAGSRNMKFKSAPLHRTRASLPEQSQIPTDMECSACKGQYVIFGIAALCPYCGRSDVRILDANLTTIEKEITDSRALRQVYNDVVITFQNECKFFAPEAKNINFQNISSSEKFFKKNHGLEILNGTNEQNLTDMKTVFEKRHVEQHNRGIYDEKYIRNLKVSKNLIGQRVTYSKDELISALEALVVVSDNLRSRFKQKS